MQKGTFSMTVLYSGRKMRKKLLAAGISISLILSATTAEAAYYDAYDVKQVSRYLETESEIRIYTYGGKTYMASGQLAVVREGNGGQETMLELYGSLEETALSENHAGQDTGGAETSAPTALTVYDSGCCYAFYSTGQAVVMVGGEAQQIIFYGYLEGYYDGEAAYPT